MRPTAAIIRPNRVAATPDRRAVQEQARCVYSNVADRMTSTVQIMLQHPIAEYNRSERCPGYQNQSNQCPADKCVSIHGETSYQATLVTVTLFVCVVDTLVSFMY